MIELHTVVSTIHEFVVLYSTFPAKLLNILLDIHVSKLYQILYTVCLYICYNGKIVVTSLGHTSGA